MTLIDKIVHYIVLFLIWTVIKLVYLSSEVEKNVTLFCIISILVLLTHMRLFVFHLRYLDYPSPPGDGHVS